MRNLKLINEITPEDLYLSIAKSKHNPCKDILIENQTNPNPGCIQNKVLQRYQEYKDMRHELHNMSSSNFSIRESECLRSCYTSDTAVSTWFFSEIEKIQDIFNRDKCPYCGINSPSTIDHYLPKESFPEYAVMSYNLVLCCGDCNGLKGTKWKDDTGRRLFIHYYFDKIPSDIFFKAKVSIRNNAPVVEFSICPPDANTDPFYDIVVTHYKELNVLERIENKVSSYVTEIFLKNKECLSKGLTEVDLKRLLSMDINSLETNHGVNYWKSAICRGVMECEEFFR